MRDPLGPPFFLDLNGHRLLQIGSELSRAPLCPWFCFTVFQADVLRKNPPALVSPPPKKVQHPPITFFGTPPRTSFPWFPNGPPLRSPLTYFPTPHSEGLFDEDTPSVAFFFFFSFLPFSTPPKAVLESPFVLWFLFSPRSFFSPVAPGEPMPVKRDWWSFS